MKTLYRDMLRRLERGESFAVVTIFDKVGSAPRGAGAEMLVAADGSIVGTIGGGRLEADAIRAAIETLPSGRSLVHAFDLTGGDAAAMDMICGGAGQILIDVVDPGDRDDRAVIEAAAEVLDRGGKAWLVTVLDAPAEDGTTRRQRCLVTPQKTMVGTLDCDPYLVEKLIAGPAKISIHAEAGGAQRFLVEELRPLGTVHLFGAGHVSQRTAPLAVSVGFRVVVVDDRPEFADRSRFAEPIELLRIDSFRDLPDLALDENSYLVVVTRGHLWDAVVLDRMLGRKVAYLGMIGSRRKRDMVFEQMRAQGHPAADIARVHAPIGTDIGAETPEELAVSIVGELIAVRAEREGGRGKKEETASGRCCEIATPEAVR